MLSAGFRELIVEAGAIIKFYGTVTEEIS